MPDDLRIPTPAGPHLVGRATTSARYRARPGGGGLNPRLVAFAAAGLGGLLLLGAGGWAVMGRRPAAIPVIEADSRPIRVKPENPGGMQVAGADEVMGDQAGGKDRMAPAAETPAPQALRAQMQTATVEAAPVAAVPASPAAAPAPVASAAPVTSAAPSASPLPDTARPVARQAAPPAPAPRPAATGGTQVQLAAVDSEAVAQAEWTRLAKRMPELLGDRKPAFQKAERDGKTVWRIRTGGFGDVAEATEFCGKMKAKGGACTIASF